MVLSLLQFNTVYNKVLLEFLQEGIVPSYSDVISRAGNLLPDVSKSNSPITQYIPQTKDGVFDVTLYNTVMETVLLDLGILFEEVNEIQINNSKRILHADLFHSVHSSLLKGLQSDLDSLLFTLGAGDDNFFARFDNFDNVTKIDLDQSTPGIVDTYEGTLSLPIGLKGSVKIDLSASTDKEVMEDFSLSRSGNSRGNIPGTRMGYIFSDATNAWGYEVKAKKQDPIELSFVFRLPREEFINRITIQHHGDKPQKVRLRTSVDKVNIKDILYNSDFQDLTDQSKIKSYDFDDTLVDYVHVTLRKEEADSFIDLPDGTKEYSFLFGIKNISLYITGRAQKATYISKPFDFSADLDVIGRIAISTEESIPENTTTKWFVAGTDIDGTIIGDYVSIGPQNKSDNTGDGNQVVLQDIISTSEYFSTPTSTLNLIESLNNIDFYSIYTLTDKPVFGTALLYRGYKSWLRDRSQAVDPVLVKDNFVPFSRGDIQSLYNVATEIHRPVATTFDQESAYGVTLSKPILYNSAVHSLKPEGEVNPDTDSAPNYAIYKAEMVLSNPTTSTTTTFEDGNNGGTDNSPMTIDLDVKIIKYTVPGDIKITRVTGSNITYRDGIDYRVHLDSDGYPTGEITGLHADMISEDPNNAPNWISIKIEYDRDTDLTRHILEIIGQQVYLGIDSGLPNVNVVWTYRHHAIEVLKPSIKAKQSFGNLSVGTSVYIEGIDYTFDSINSTIQRLSTGSIPIDRDIYVDYKYNDINENIEQFFIWAKASSINGIDITTETETSSSSLALVSSLEPDTSVGEDFLASIEGLGLLSLADSVHWPRLKGYTQFVVKSKNPENHDNSLIRQVLTLKDDAGDFIFVQGGKYFDELTAIREPLAQVSYPFLKTNVLLNDNTKFAVRELLLGNTVSYQIMINTQPNSSESFYSFTPSDSTGTSGVLGLEPIEEEWKLKWVSKSVNASAFTHVRVKCELERSTETSGNLTPKVKHLYIKTGY
jgi:hypothetical protein